MEHQEKKYWQSLKQLEPGHTETSGEFLSSPIRAGVEPKGEHSSADEGVDDESRRTFLKIMGAGIALAGASACTRRPVEKIVPYLNQPEEVTPGIANWYASTCGECEAGCGVLVKTREGRPIKFEGNPSHPMSQGALCTRGQASVLNVYDPDRLQSAVDAGRNGGTGAVTWDAVDARVVEKLRAGGRVRVLTGALGPSTETLLNEFLRGAGSGQHVVYEAMGEQETAQANEASYGTRVVPRYRLELADMIVSFGADFLGTWHQTVGQNRGFAKARSERLGGPKKMARFVAFEPLMTTTGSNADARYRVRSGDEVKVALAVASELIVAMGHTRFAGDAAVTSVLRKYPAATVAAETGVPAEALKATARELWNARGKGVVFGGGQSVKGDLGVALDVVVNLLNSALENEGATIDGTVSPTRMSGSFDALVKLVEEMRAGQVDLLLIHGVNPVYGLPKSVGFAAALSKVKLVATFATHLDETAAVSDLALGVHHSLENWGDASPNVGLHSVLQPTISPLYATHGFEESLMAWAKRVGMSGAITSQPTWLEYLKSRWKQEVHGAYGVSTPFALFWESVLREGFFDGVAARGNRNTGPVKARSFNSSSLALVEKAGSVAAGTTLTLYPKVSMSDGRNSNNGWLHEFPDPVTKITWDNYAMISPAHAKKLGVAEGDVLRLSVGDAVAEVPAHIQPGMHDATVAVAVGYGRQGAGRVGNGVGTNVFPLARPGSRALQMSGLSVKVEKTGRSELLACTQAHHTLEGRPIVKEASYAAFQLDPQAGNKDKERIPSLWPAHDYPGYRWGMAIDMSACTGCGACVVACQAENNVPIVGKKFVAQGREMHWIRIDRYYSGGEENPEVVHQPMLCQHCENAPCETVCPVLATVHDDEGLNEQVYNRCVGTRYCSNNCPYKVRRFNWYTFTDVAKPLELAYNPDLTVRTRGIMEKCTFCVQRIRESKDRAKDFGRKVVDGEVKTACQQTCPTDAIVFGNVNDKASRVAKLIANPRGYHILEELNVRPSITYMTKIRNKT